MAKIESEIYTYMVSTYEIQHIKHETKRKSKKERVRERNREREKERRVKDSGRNSKLYLPEYS
ncbi:MAG TPA: hypothetical protein VJ863_08275 [Sphaerochaeta sp.]|nr:hypothetical protein [Sphaerochaeta sp.]